MIKTTFTLAEAAELLNCHPETLRRAIHDGFLQAARLGREYRLSRSDLQAFWTARGGGQLFAPGVTEREDAWVDAGVELRDRPPVRGEDRQPEDRAQRWEDPASSVKQLSFLVPPGSEP